MISDDVCSHFKASNNGLTNVFSVARGVRGQMEKKQVIKKRNDLEKLGFIIFHGKKQSFDLKNSYLLVHGPMGHCSSV